MKKILSQPMRLLLAVVVVAVVVVLGGLAYKQYTSPYKNLTPEQRVLQKKVDTLENCLAKAKNLEAQQSVIEAEMQKCRTQYPDV